MERIFLLRTVFSVVAATGILTAPAVAQKEKEPVVVTGAVAVTNTVDVNVVSPDSNGGSVDASNVESFFCNTENMTVPFAVCVDQITVNAPVALSWLSAALFHKAPQFCRLKVSVDGNSGGTSTLFQLFVGNKDGSSAENTSIIYPKPLLLQAGDIIQFEVRESSQGTTGTGTCWGAVSFPLEPQQSQ